MKRIKQILIAVGIIALLSGLSSCKTGCGCPGTDFSMEIMGK